KQYRFDGGQCRAVLKIDFQVTLQLAGGEQDRFLREPIKMRPGANPERDVYAGEGAGGAIAALASLRGEHHLASGCDFGAPLQVITACQSAGGVDEHRFKCRGMGVGKADLAAAVLKEAVEAC